MRFNNHTFVARRIPTCATWTAATNRSSFSTHLRLYSPIMPAKRKRAAVQSPSLEEGTNPRRRSSRIIDKEETAPADIGTPPDGLGIIAGSGKKSRRKGTGRDSKKDVQRAMKSLQDMEDQLQSAVKRQQMAVENSELNCELDPDLDGNTTVPIMRSGKSTVINEHDRENAHTAEQAPLDGDEAAVASRDVEPHTMEEDGVERGARRMPPVNSEMLPLPWKGRLGYACLNTYLRASNPPVFSSRTCRIASILDHRHPLQNPDEPEHPTKNRPDKTQPADPERGLKFVQELGLANARDIVKMIRWNHKFGINFMRLSSEMFPFASHHEYGYSLAPFAAETLAEAGKVAGELGHRVTTHPGQFTQLGSPRKEVITAAVRDLDYHAEMLSLLKLPEQMDRDAVMILHMGGTYGDKEATLDRFRTNYAKLSDGVKARLVLENDDVAWSVHDLLPICEELNIPFVLDYHHHNIIFDQSIREGSHDIMAFYDRIRATWTRKKITQKMHYSEQTSVAVTPRERRKHSARVRTLPPCPQDMDLMIEAKDKEQAVFELMRTFKLPGWNLFNDIVPYERDDESRKAIMKKKTPKKKKSKAKKNGTEDVKMEDADPEDDIEVPEKIVSAEEFGMGGPERRVFWPEGMEEWLRPKKREIKKGKNSED